ncbi:MAG TPA: pilus assembly protein TadG-related protein [Pyrinomonadaceae bacterium]|nr:pilus assembly protein TadG-related protein [Pyrinomonadaceae bacterium]
MSVMERKTDRKGERGSVLAIASLGMLTLLLAVGLGVDISRMYLTKTELQNASDAAALAGVSGLDGSPSGITKATNRAVQAMNNYAFNKTNVAIPRANVLFAVNLDGPYMSEGAASAAATNIRFVRVTTPDLPSSVSFAAPILGDKRDLSATATAGFSVPINVFCNFIPLSVIDYDVPMMPGNVYTIRSGPSNSPSPGNYQILAVAGRGGSSVEFGIGGGVDACAEAGATYDVDTKPGVTAGKVRTGVNSRFDDYQGSQLDPAQYPPDTNVKENITYDQYRDGTAVQVPTHTGVPGRRIVIIPIVKLSEYDPGRNTVKFNRFGVFFLRTKVGSGNGGDIQAEYIDDIVVAGTGGYDPNGGAANNLLATPVLYK